MRELNISLDDLAARCRPERLTAADVRQTRATLRTAGAWAELAAVGDGVVHVLWHLSEQWENEPTRYAVDAGRRRGPAWRLNRAARTLTAGTATIEYKPDPLRLRFADERGTFLAESTDGLLGYLEAGVAITWDISESEQIYGLGQNASADLNRVGQIRGMAAMHTGAAGGDVPIAFWVSTRGYGVVVDNPNVGSFDLTTEGRVTFRAGDGYLSYYVLWGPTMADVLRRYADLTGRPPMPPRWWFGPLFSRIPGGRVPGYRSAAELVALGRKLRAREIPAAGLILDFQWDEWIGAFRWDPKRFGRARWMLRELRRLGFDTLVQLKPAINLPAPTMGEVRRNDLALKRRDGSIHTSNYHRGRSVFLDFFKEQTGRWYGKQLSRLLADGVGGWWTDEGDWVGFESQAARDLERAASGIRNLYNNAWCRTIYDYQRRTSRRRVVNLTRTGSVGIQRYGTSLWSGDVSATWEGLAAQLPMGLNAGLSGIPFWTTDGGGFVGNPTPELYVRWAQFAVFSPLTRFHGCGPREPWHFGPRAEKAVRDILRWRMRLMPYVYATAWQAHTQGLPMMRAMAMSDPDDRRFANLSSQYMFGDSLLVRPVTVPLSTIRKQSGRVRTELPPGRWYDFWTGQPIGAAVRTRAVRPTTQSQSHRNASFVTTRATLDHVPVYVRAPAILVLAEPSDSPRRHSWKTLTAGVYVGDMSGPWQTTFELFEDDGSTYAYETGAFPVTRLTAKRTTACSLTLAIAPTGTRAGAVRPQRRWRLELFGMEREPVVSVNRRTLPTTKRDTCWLTDLRAVQTNERVTVTVSAQ